MDTDAEAQAAIQGLHDQDHDGRRLTVDEAKPRVARTIGFAGGSIDGSVAPAVAVVMEVVAVPVLIVRHLGGFRGDHSCGPSIPPVATMSRVTAFGDLSPADHANLDHSPKAVQN